MIILKEMVKMLLWVGCEIAETNRKETREPQQTPYVSLGDKNSPGAVNYCICISSGMRHSGQHVLQVLWALLLVPCWLQDGRRWS